MPELIIKNFSSLQDYIKTWEAMKQFTETRGPTTPDELWVLEHPPVFTQGQAGKPEHVLDPHGIPIVQTDRGGQVTYHGPGQIVAYTLFDIQRLNLSTRGFVRQIEQTVIDCLSELGISAQAREDAPGVYVNGAKICSIGLRVRKGLSYHGIAFNVDMDLKPFSYINPCGYQGLQMAQVKDFVPDISIQSVQEILTKHFQLKHKAANPEN